MMVKFRYRYCSVEMFYNFKRALIENIILLVLFSEDRNFAIHNNLVLASFRKINLIFVNLLVWLIIVAFYEMSSFAVIQVVICRTLDWKYNNTVKKKSIILVPLVYSEEHHKWLYIYFNSRPPPFENHGYAPGDDGATDWIWLKMVRDSSIQTNKATLR